MRTLGLAMAFAGWIVFYTAFSIWLAMVISQQEHPDTCSGATSSRIGAPAAGGNQPEPATSTYK